MIKMNLVNEKPKSYELDSNADTLEKSWLHGFRPIRIDYRKQKCNQKIMRAGRSYPELTGFYS